MSFKDISYLELWLPFCSVEQYHFRKFGRGYHEDQFCEIILRALAVSGTICAILVEGRRNNSVKLF